MSSMIEPLRAENLFHEYPFQKLYALGVQEEF